MMMRLRLYHLQGDYKKIEECLKAMVSKESSFKSTMAYHYYKAQTFWRKV